MQKVTSSLLREQYGLEWINKRFVFLWISQVFTQISEEIISLSLTVLVFELFGTGAALGTFFLVKALPSVLLSPVAGVFIDRFNRRTVSMIAAFASAIVTVVIPVAHDGLSILIVAFFIATVNAVTTPALQAALPQVVDKDRLLPANSAISATESVARFTVPALSVTVVGMLGTSAGFFVAAVAYILAGCTLIPLKLAEPVKDNEAAQLTVKIVWENLIKGLNYLIDCKLLLWTAIVSSGIMLADSTVEPLFTIMVNRELHMPPAYIGYLSAGYGVGFLVGALLLPLLKRWTTEQTLMSIGSLFIGAQMLAYSQIHGFWFAIPLQIICGIGFAFLSNARRSIVQMTAPHNLTGRVLSTISAFSASVRLFGAKTGGMISDTAGVRIAFMIGGCLSIIIGLSFLTATNFVKARQCE